MRDRRALPGWVEQINHRIAAQTAQKRTSLPTWHNKLWQHIRATQPTRLLLTGTIEFSEKEQRILRVSESEVRCGLGRPVTSAQGTHGVHLLLVDEEQPAQTAALLLTPATFTRFQAGPGRQRPNIRTQSLAEPLIVLETKRLRGEFTILDVAYDQESAQSSLLVALTIEAVVWQKEPPSK